MFCTLSRSAPGPSTNTRRLDLEALESRHCPSTFTATQALPVSLSTHQDASGPYTVVISYMSLSGHNVSIGGMVVSAVGAKTVQIEGAVQGLVKTDDDGTFNITAQADHLGDLFAGVVSGTDIQ